MSPRSYSYYLSVFSAVLLTAPVASLAATEQQPTPGSNAAPSELSASAPTAAPNSAIAAESSTPSEPETTVDELIQKALVNSPQIQIARETVNAAQQRLTAAKAQGNPVLQVVPGFTGNSQARDEEIILSQPIDVFGRRRARAAVARAEVRRVQSQGTLSERTLVVSVKNAATDLFAAQEAEFLTQVQVDVAQLFRDAAARRAQLGDVPPVQVQRADLELLRAKNDLTSAQTERLVRRAALNQLVGQSPETPLKVVLPVSTDIPERSQLTIGSQPVPNTGTRPGNPSGQIPSTPPVDMAPPATAPLSPAPTTPVLGASSQIGSDLLGTRSELLPRALQRPDIVGAEATLEGRRAQIQVLKSELRPSIELQARRSPVTSSGSTSLRAVLVMPLLDLGSNRGERRALEAEVRAQEAQISFLRSQAAAQVEQALLRLRQQRETLESYRTGIVPNSVSLLRKTQIGYGLGASTYIEVLDAQRTLRQTQAEYLQALVGTRTSEAQLETALGGAAPAGVFSPSATSNPSLSPPSDPATQSPDPLSSNNPAASQGGR